MEKCANCGLESKYLYGPMANLCNECCNIFGYTQEFYCIEKEKEDNVDGKNNNP